MYILGEVDDDINFSYGANTEVHDSCAASMNDEMWVFGGHSKRRQVNFEWPGKSSDIDNCWMVRNKIYFRWAKFKIAD